MILLDTNVVVAFLNGDRSVLRRMRAEIGEIALSTLVVAELDYGAKVSQKSEENIEKLYRLVDIVQVIPEVDALIAATAMAHEAVLITANKKHFENIEGLKVEVWPIGKEV
jgi:tRNA(fMet)-specific endonuclease VapC